MTTAAQPEEARPEGARSAGPRPEGAQPEGSLQDVDLPEGAPQDGALPEGALPEGAPQDGAEQEGALRDGALRSSAPPAAETTTARVRYFAGARAAAGGVAEEDVPIPAARACVADVLSAIAERHGSELERVLAACSFLLDEVSTRDRAAPVPEGSVLDVLPPFAGG
ncbi:MoaD/ThiS family protein [Salinifilum ghardaiensis]